LVNNYKTLFKIGAIDGKIITKAKYSKVELEKIAKDWRAFEELEL
jgi:hypothetical protein